MMNLQQRRNTLYNRLSTKHRFKFNRFIKSKRTIEENLTIRLSRLDENLRYKMIRQKLREIRRHISILIKQRDKLLTKIKNRVNFLIKL